MAVTGLNGKTIFAGQEITQPVDLVLTGSDYAYHNKFSDRGNYYFGAQVPVWCVAIMSSYPTKGAFDLMFFNHVGNNHTCGCRYSIGLQIESHLMSSEKNGTVWGYNDTAYYVTTNIINVAIDSTDDVNVPIFTSQDDAWSAIFTDPPWIPHPIDPYRPGGTTVHGGGHGSFDDTSDPQTFPPAPTASVTDVKFISLWNPTKSELQSVCTWLWSNNFDLDTLKKLFSNPMDCIIGLSLVPVTVPHGTSVPITIGNIQASGVLVRPATSQYVTKNFGSVTVDEFYGGYLDYSPYTKVEIYLPYIGIKELSADDVMNRSVEVQYNIDILSGACVALIKCGSEILYQFAGNCSMPLPIVGRDMLSVISGTLGVLSGAGKAVAGIAAGDAAGAAQAVAAMSSAAVQAMRSKRNVEKSGSIVGSAGFMGLQTPYLIITRPRQALPDSQSIYTGYPSFVTSLLGNCSGFTTLAEVHLDGIPATDTEISEIESLLKTGVIF